MRLEHINKKARFPEVIACRCGENTCYLQRFQNPPLKQCVPIGDAYRIIVRFFFSNQPCDKMQT